MTVSPLWSPNSWRDFPVEQVPDYEDLSQLRAVEKELLASPPLIFAGEARRLEHALAEAAFGKAFLLQGGDCAESFSLHSGNMIRDFFNVFLQMALVMTYAATVPIIKVGRIAGQYAKPRSSPTEKRGDVELPSYRGDIINEMAFTPESRKADPQRQIIAYHQSAACLNLLRAFSTGGYASIENARRWMLDFVSESPQAARYESLVQKITQALDFMRAIGFDLDTLPQSRYTQLYTSHEALLLGYEESLTRLEKASNTWFATSAHMLWIGDRTRQLDHAHVEFCRGIQNPIGIKCGPSLLPEELTKLIDAINPENRPGRVTLICRFGVNKIEAYLPPLIHAVLQEKKHVVWICDPMHGNTVVKNGFKTRPFESILQEVKLFFSIHYEKGSHPSGVHLEMTGQNVTECTGGQRGISCEELSARYHTQCDPRLNAEQAVEMAFLIADLLKRRESH